MREHRWAFVFVIVVVLLLLLYSVAFTVNFQQIAIVKTFGSAGEPIRGSDEAGLHWKWPWPIQSLVRYDARTLVFDDTFEQVQTKDKQNLLVTVFCGWRIKDAETFLPNITTAAEAEDRLRSIVRSTKKAIVGRHLMADFVNTDPERMEEAGIPKIEKEILEGLRDEQTGLVLEGVRQIAMRDYGVEVVTLGIKSVGLPKEVTKKVIDNMKEERNREAQRYRGRGQAVADEIRKRAEAARKLILAFADNRAKLIRAEGDRAAAEYYAKFKEDEAFAIFLRRLEFLKETFKKNAVFLLDPSVEASIGFLNEGPSLPALAQQPTTMPAGGKP